jgi:hypothetical protein
MDLSVFQRDMSDLSAALSQGLEALTFGSFADRNPGLGGMVRCPHCRQHRREFATEKCCNAGHAATQRAWTSELGFHQEPCPPRVVEDFIDKDGKPKKSFIRKFSHKRHGQNRAWHIRQTAARMQADAEFLKFAASEMHVAIPKQEHIPAFAERFWLWNQKRVTKQQRIRQQQARRINFGLV